MKIRTATLADCAAIAAIESECFPPAEAAPEASIRARLTRYPDHFWLLEDGEVLVGFVNGMVTDSPDLTDALYARAELHREDGAWQMIFGVDTLPAYRRRGCAEALLRHVIAAARIQGRRGLVLTCKEHLLHYYARLGFVDEGISGSTHGGAVWHQMRLTF